MQKFKFWQQFFGLLHKHVNKHLMILVTVEKLLNVLRSLLKQFLTLKKCSLP